MLLSRRDFLEGCSALALFGGQESVKTVRRYHLSLSPDALEEDPELLEVVREAGVRVVWLTGFLYGFWHYAPERIDGHRKRIEKAGMAAQVINVPLGHPGDSLGAKAGDVPLTPPRHWKPGVRPDGSLYAGTSLHLPATSENREALRRLRGMGVRQVFLDDDFRLAQGPGVIGGCYCEAHRQEFLSLHGYPDARWAELLEAARTRTLTPLLRQWIEFHCDKLTESFRDQQEAAPEIALGIMVMYLGAEKAGIRLSDYRRSLFRVGELMFDDASFAPVKGKTNELFSALFHRRYAAPERAFSETTAFPAQSLSARNMAAKLIVSTLSDVRNTMFMSGISAFPRSHWQTLAPAMKKQAALHERLAGHAPRGPFKHFWGEAERYVGEDNPYSLFLATGVPFEVTGEPARDGWTFLADADARAASAGTLRSRGTAFITRPEAGKPPERGQSVAETLPALFAWRREILPRLGEVPYVEEEKPVVCAWYPSLRCALIWNLSESRERLTVRFRQARRVVEAEGLDAALVSLEERG
jgi:hypothetical protein